MSPFTIGIDAVHQIKRASPRTKVVVFTSSQDDETILVVLAAGASVCLTEDMRRENLIGAIQSAVNDEPGFHPRITALIIEKLHPAAIDKINSSYILSEQEYLVLSRKVMGFSNRMISDELSISERMVIGHLSNILHKLHLAGRVEAVMDTPQEILFLIVVIILDEIIYILNDREQIFNS